MRAARVWPAIFLPTASAHAARAKELKIGLGRLALVIDGRMLFKPDHAADARLMLETLSGRCHQVLTGICLRRGNKRICDCAATQVWFAAMTAQEIDEYVASGEPMDKAGAYAIQGLASKFIERVDGCYFNGVGLPIALLYKTLKYF